MCLILPTDPYLMQDIWRNIPGGIGQDLEILGYKRLCRSDDGVYTSPMFYYNWGIGLNVSSRESVELTKEEKESGIVKLGFSFFAYRPTPEPPTVIISMRVRPDDIVAIGHYQGVLSLVATRATWV